MQIKVGYNPLEMACEIYEGQELEDVRSITVNDNMYSLVYDGDEESVEELYRRYRVKSSESFNYRLIKSMLEYYVIKSKKHGGEGVDGYGVCKKYKQID